MAKRPFVWINLSFIVGCLFTQINSVKVVVFLGAIFIVLFLLCMKWKWKDEIDLFFLSLIPVCFIFGFLSMSRQQKPHPFQASLQKKEQVELIGKVVDYKETTTSKQITISNVCLVAENKQDNIKKKRICDKLLIYHSNDLNYKIGNTIYVKGQIQNFQKPSNPGQFNEYQYYKSKNILFKVTAKEIQIQTNTYYWYKQKLYDIKQILNKSYKQLFSEKDYGTVSAMILGEKGQLDNNVKQLFSNQGIGHILAISGLHISFIGLALFSFLKLVGVWEGVAATLTTLFLFSYGILTGFGISTNRAVVMLLITLGARLLGRTYDILSSVSLSSFLILCQSPLCLYEAGYLLSFGAILGIAIVYPLFQKMIIDTKREKRGEGVIVKEQIIQTGLLATISIQLVTMPIIILFYFEIPIYSIFLNLIIIPLMSIVVFTSFFSGIVGCFSVLLGSFFAGSVHTILSFYEWICTICSKLPYYKVIIGKPSIIQIILYYSVLAMVIWLASNNKTGKRWITLWIGICFSIAILLIRPNITELQISFLDIGQGDAIFIQAPNKKTYFIDGGSSNVSKCGTYRIKPFLKSKGVHSIDFWFVSHFDDDHISGLRELMEEMKCGEIQIKTLVIPAYTMIDEVYEQFFAIAREKKIAIKLLKEGDTLQEGKLRWTCYHPSATFKGNSRNDYSLVLLLSYNNFHALFTGDLEEEGEYRIQSKLPKIDLLKVAHHGSNYSTYYPFLKNTNPNIAVISCGIENRYGHPGKEAVERLKKAGCKIFYTMFGGAVIVSTDGKKLAVDYFKDNL